MVPEAKIPHLYGHFQTITFLKNRLGPDRSLDLRIVQEFGFILMQGFMQNKMHEP